MNGITYSPQWLFKPWIHPPNPPPVKTLPRLLARPQRVNWWPAFNINQGLLQGSLAQPVVPQFRPLDGPDNRWWGQYDFPRFQALVQGPIQGATIQQSVPMPRFLDSPELARYAALDVFSRRNDYRYNPAQGVTIQQANPPRFTPLDPPRSDWWTREFSVRVFDRAPLQPIGGFIYIQTFPRMLVRQQQVKWWPVFGRNPVPLQGPTLQANIPPRWAALESPDKRWYSQYDAPRFKSDLIQWAHYAPVKLQTHPVPKRDISDLQRYLALDIFSRRQDQFKVPILGLAPAQLNPQFLLLTPPDIQRYLALDVFSRRNDRFAPPIQGPTIQQNIPRIPLLDTPDLTRYLAIDLRSRRDDASKFVNFGLNPSATYPALLDTPDRQRYLYLDTFSRRSDGLFGPIQGPTIQTELPSMLDYTQWIVVVVVSGKQRGGSSGFSLSDTYSGGALPDLGYFISHRTPRQPAFTARFIPGRSTPQTYPNLLDSPDQFRYFALQLKRFAADLNIPIDGPASRQSIPNPYLLDTPDQIRYAAAKIVQYTANLNPPIDGASNIPSFPPLLDIPDLNGYYAALQAQRYNTPLLLPILGPTAIVTVVVDSKVRIGGIDVLIVSQNPNIGGIV